jgi:S-DNA-T family DNA segregation ATPase FtsK/SpoIIIE
VILGHGWAVRGYTAADIDPAARGVGWLIAEGGIPRRMRAAFLTDDQVRELAAVAARRRAAARETP